MRIQEKVVHIKLKIQVYQVDKIFNKLIVDLIKLCLFHFNFL
jgi:hypothetical protein